MTPVLFRLRFINVPNPLIRPQRSNPGQSRGHERLSPEAKAQRSSSPQGIQQTQQQTSYEDLLDVG